MEFPRKDLTMMDQLKTFSKEHLYERTQTFNHDGGPALCLGNDPQGLYILVGGRLLGCLSI